MKIIVIYNSKTGFTKRYAEWIAEATGADKKLIAFCVGGSPIDNPEIDIALKRNFNESEQKKVKTFYCPGGFNYEKMSTPLKLMMKMFIKTLKAKKDKTEVEQIMVKMISSSYDISDKKYVEPILQYLKN